MRAKKKQNKTKKMANNRNDQKSIPFVHIDPSSITNSHTSYISVSSSEESIPNDAPLALAINELAIGTVWSDTSEKNDENDSSSSSEAGSLEILGKV